LEEWRNAIVDLFGFVPSDRYPTGSGNPVTGFSTEPDLLLVSEPGVSSIMAAAEEVAEALPTRLDDVVPCASDGDACAESFLDTIGHRAFRRPLTDEERGALGDLYRAERLDGSSFADALAVMTAAMLQMPAFLYVLEGDASSGEDRPRSGPELALRLSLSLWDSIPDDELLDAAENDELSTPAQVRRQAQRMLDDPRSDRGLRRFFREWTETSEVAVASKDRGAFPYLDDELSNDINESFDRFVSDQVHGGGTLQTLLRSNSAFARGGLSDFFGVESSQDWTRASLPEDAYAGIATQPALLAALSHTVSPSYVFRGRFITTRLLCLEFAPPPANAQAEFGNLTLPEDPTGKETAEVVEAKSGCGGCHTIIDPAGLAFEHFDGLGHYRDEYDSGKTIDTSGTLIGAGDEPISFDGPADLMEQLAARPEVGHCFATQLFRYSAAAKEQAEDSCSIQTIVDALETTGGTLEDAILASTQTDQFLYRRGE
jgi:hypothetical protein